jgi:hypothetical protein
MSDRSTRARRERGASAVEMAFLTILLFILAAGTVDLGRALFTYVAVQDAAQEGTLYGSYRPEEAGPIQARVVGSTDFPAIAPADVEVSCPEGSPTGGDAIAVRVTHEVDLITPIVGAFLGGSIELSSEHVGQVFNGECLT